MPENEKLSILSRISLILASPALRFAPFVLVLILGATGLLVKPAMNIQNDDDVIKFLPQDDPKVVKFMEIGDQFHGLQMAIVGVEANKNPDLFNVDDLMLIRLASRELKLLECHDKNTGEPAFCVSNTTSFTEIKDIAHSTRDTGEEESSVDDLVPDLPMVGTPEASSPEVAQMLDQVKARTLSLDHVRGFLVSPDARAAAVYAQVDDTRVSTKEAADMIRAKVLEIKERLGVDVNLYYGGSPFIGGYSADQSRLDMAKLSPWVIAIVVLIILITSKSILATLISLFSVAISLVCVIGGMSLFGMKMTLVATSLPILLVALGSAYAIHLISAMLSNLDSGDSRRDAMRKAVIHTGPPIIVCVLTTAAGFFSFLIMDVEPMVEYGGAMGLATLLMMFVTFWFVTSACIICPIRAKKGGRAPVWATRLMKKFADGVYNNGKKAAVGVALIALVCAFFTTKVEPHGDNSSLFAPGSLPIVVDDFMNDNFGGSNFIQTQINGNINNPLVLRQIERMTAYINAHPRIAGVQSISEVIVLVGGTMGDGQHIPASATLAATLASLAFADDASVEMMAEMTWKSSLMQIRVAGKDISEGARLADEIQEATKPLYQPRISVPRDKLDEAAVKIEQEEIIQHLQWIFKKYEKDLSHDDIYRTVFEQTATLDRNDVRMVTNINLFDENDALIYMDENKIKAFAFNAIAPDSAFKPAVAENAETPDADAADAPKDNAVAANDTADNDDSADAGSALNCVRNDERPECIEYFAEQYSAQYDESALDIVSTLIAISMEEKSYSKEWLMTTLQQFAEDDELSDMTAFEKSVDFIMTAFKEQDLEKLRKQRTAKLFELAQVTNPSEKFKQLVESAVWCLGDAVAFLPKNDVSPAVLAAAVESQEFEVIPSGYPVIYRAMNASVIHNQIWSLVCSFIMVFIVLCFFIGVIRAAIVSLIPASMTVLLTFATMGACDIGMDVGSSMIAAISLSVGIDYACHLIWKYRVSNLKPKQLAADCASADGSVSLEAAETHIQKASDRMLETTGWGIVINALEVGLGLSVLYFGELLPMRNFGLLTGFAMIVSAFASLVLLSALLRTVSMHRLKRYIRN